MMMAVLSFFRYDDHDESVRRVHEVTRVMLRSYLRANHGEAEYSSARIFRFNRRCMQGHLLQKKKRRQSIWPIITFYN